MALVDLALRRGYIGGSFGLLRVTLGRVSLEGWREPLPDEATDEEHIPFVWFEGLRRECWFSEAGDSEWKPDELVGHGDEIAGFKVLS